MSNKSDKDEDNKCVKDEDHRFSMWSDPLVVDGEFYQTRICMGCGYGEARILQKVR